MNNLINVSKFLLECKSNYTVWIRMSSLFIIKRHRFYLYLMYTQPFPLFGATHIKRNFRFLFSDSDWTMVFMHSGWNVTPSSSDSRWSEPEWTGEAASLHSSISPWQSLTTVTKNEWKSKFSLSIVTASLNVINSIIFVSIIIN